MQNQPRTLAIAMPYGSAVDRGTAHRVLRNTYALLSMTLLFSAAVAWAAVAFSLPAPGLILTLVAYFGLLFGIHKLKNRGAAVGLVFAGMRRTQAAPRGPTNGGLASEAEA